MADALDWPDGGYVARATANRGGRRDARGDPTAAANMARVPIKIPPENSLRAIFFPGLPACSAFPTTHTLHPSHQYARWEGYGVGDPALHPLSSSSSSFPPSILHPSLSALCLYLSRSSLSSLVLSSAVPFSPLSTFFSLHGAPFPLCARARARVHVALVFVFIISADSFFNSFPPFFGDLIVMYTHACDPPACRTYITAPRAAVAHRLRREMHSA